MTLDERLDRLTERHEALTHSVELLTAELRTLTSDVNGMRGLMDDMLTGMARLVHVAEIHERRRERLEGQGE